MERRGLARQDRDFRARITKKGKNDNYKKMGGA